MLLLLILTVYGNVAEFAHAQCSFPTFGVCRKFKVIYSKSSLHTAFYAPPGKEKDTANYCYSLFEDVTSGQIENALTKTCPKIDKDSYIVIHPACNDVIGGLPSPDTVEVFNDQECEMAPAENLKRVKSLLGQIKVGEKLGDLKGLRLRLIGHRDLPKAEGANPLSNDFIMVLHAFPGVSLDVRLKGCEWGKGNCNSHSPITWPVKEVGQPREDYVSERECLLWGGQPGTSDELRKTGFMPFGELGELKSCRASGIKKFNAELVKVTPSPTGPIQGAEFASVLTPKAGEQLLEKCPQAFPKYVKSFWVPNEAWIKRLEAELPGSEEFKKQFGKNLEIRKFYRQYLGIIEGGGKSVQVRIVAKETIDKEHINWKESPFSDCENSIGVWWVVNERGRFRDEKVHRLLFER